LTIWPDFIKNFTVWFQLIGKTKPPLGGEVDLGGVWDTDSQPMLNLMRSLDGAGRQTYGNRRIAGYRIRERPPKRLSPHSTE